VQDLFDLNIVSADPKYLAIRDCTEWEPIKAQLEAMWRRFEYLADPNFRGAFARDLDQRFWELYLGCCLLDRGFDVVAANPTGGPDFHIRLHDRDLWVEAVTPTDGAGADALPSPYGRNGYDPLPVEKVVLRFTNAIAAKCQKRDQYITGGVIGRGDPFVIAVNGGGIWMAAFEDPLLPRIVQAVYPLGAYQIDVDCVTLESIREGHLLRTEIPKVSGAVVPTNIFLDPTYCGISSILYCDCRMSRMSQEAGSEFVSVHNALAEGPLDIGWFGTGVSYWWNVDHLECKRIEEPQTWLPGPVPLRSHVSVIEPPLDSPWRSP
jgi:hypothetical protein